MTASTMTTSTPFSAPPQLSSAQPDSFVRDRLPLPADCPRFQYTRPELQIADQANLVETLFNRAFAQGYAGRPFLRSAAVTLSYADAFAQVNRISQLLIAECRLVPGNRVLLRGGNSIAMALAWLAVVNAGLVAVATMPLLRAKELGEVMARAQPALALCDAALCDELLLAQQANGQAIGLLMFNAADDPASLEQRAARQSCSFTPCPTRADDIAMMAFTSGTTGQPKAAVHSHRAILAACETWPRHVLKITENDIVIGSPPLAFTFGLGGLLVFPMWAGASVYFPNKAYTPQTMLALAAQVRASVMVTAPTFYRQMAALAEAEALPALRLCVSAGEGLPDVTRQSWKAATGLELIDGIGATEMFHIFISSDGDDIRRGAIGKVVTGYTAKVVDDDGKDVPRGTLGKLAVIGPTGCRYLNDARQGMYVKDGWNYPGDTFTQDADGYFFYHARADDMIVTSGYNVAGPEVEQALLAHAAVLECAVVGVPDTERGSIVKAFVVLKPGEAASDALAHSLQDHVKATLAPFKYPRQIEFRASLPRTETGKLQRYKLRAP